MSKIKLSKLAEEVLSQTIKESGIPSNKGLRLKKFEGGLTLTTDSPSDGDRIIKRGKELLLIINKKLEKQIGKATIDISDIGKKPKLVIIKHKMGDEA